MTEVIATDNSLLTTLQSLTLRILASMIVPEDSSRGMPAAGELDIATYIASFVSNNLESVKAELETLSDLAQSRFGTDFTALGEDDRHALLAEIRKSESGWGRNIVVQVLSCYYQDERVVRALGVESTPPWPAGNEVPLGDLSLLDPVRERAAEYQRRIYRE